QVAALDRLNDLGRGLLDDPAGGLHRPLGYVQKVGGLGGGDLGQICPRFQVRPRALPHVLQLPGDHRPLAFREVAAVEVGRDHEGARSSAEMLEARDLARVAYDAAKIASRMAKAKQAHDSLIADVHRAQANALAIRARAEFRLAEEYDAAQDRGDVRAANQGRSASALEAPSAPDLGLSHKDIHNFRKRRDREKADPGATQRALDDMVARGEEPTRAALKHEMIAPPAATDHERQVKAH
ncbi:hypothetical protein G5B31_20635, partial [Rhodobacter sp. SGA-6-6]|uniref:hypothetical protein n=1 Tax=Rhodobacter sp. SGA-6-6 TaxID=2710882 RepID=UPI0013FBC20D